MNLSQSLRSFLIKRPNKKAQFCIGDWLTTLDDQKLQKLAKYSETSNLPEDETVFYLASQEMGKIIRMALKAETNSREEINNIEAVLFRIEKLNGLVKLVMRSREGLAVLTITVN